MKKSKANINIKYEKKHKPLPDFEWRGDLSDYYRDGECYYTVTTITATCGNSNMETEPVYGSGGNSKKRALARLTEICSCGSRWHYTL